MIDGGDCNDYQKEGSRMKTRMEKMTISNMPSPSNESIPVPYRRGNITLDRAWVSAELAGFMEGYIYLTFGLGFTNYTWFVVDARCSQCKNSVLSERKQRNLNSTNAQSVDHFLKMVMLILKKQNLYKRISDLEGKRILTEEEVRRQNIIYAVMKILWLRLR